MIILIDNEIFAFAQLHRRLTRARTTLWLQQLAVSWHKMISPTNHIHGEKLPWLQQNARLLLNPRYPDRGWRCFRLGNASMSNRWLLDFPWRISTDVATVDEGPSVHKAIEILGFYIKPDWQAPSSLGTRLSKLVFNGLYTLGSLLTPLLSSFRATIQDSYKVFIAPIQVQMQIVPRWTTVPVPWLAKFKAFSFPVN